MKPTFLLLPLFCLFIRNASTQTPPADPASIRPVDFTAVQVTDDFWAPRIKLNHDVTIPIALRHCYTTKRVDNFLFAGGLKEGYFCTQFPFDDTDIYKIIEGAAYTLHTVPDPRLEAQVDSLIHYIGRAQEPDGYLFTPRTAAEPGNPHPWIGEERWVKTPELSHELYNSGHLFEAAVAHYKATGKRSLLDIAVKNADLLVREFGPGKTAVVPGHQVVEMGLVKLYGVTGNREYLDLAQAFLEARGDGGEYSQSHKKVTEQSEAVGHAVRATYMYAAMADIAALTGNPDYLAAIDRIWEDVVGTKYYITGGIGAEGGHEGFGPAYELPNMSAYNETCAAIGNVYWNHRLFLLHGESKFYDVLERTLYNGLLSGVAMSGDRFFYPNPLESTGQHSRSEWFGCACCPSNVARFIPAVPGYVYATGAGSIYVNLYMSNRAVLNVDNTEVTITQNTGYPWQGEVAITVDPAKKTKLALRLRIPGWAQGTPVPGNLYRYTEFDGAPIRLTVNGKDYDLEIGKDGYATIDRTWKKGDVVILSLPIFPRRVQADERVTADRGKIALERGPIVYCLEWPDNDNAVLNSVLPERAAVRPVYNEIVPGGIWTLQADGESCRRDESGALVTEPKTLTAIPYYAWAHRGSGEMSVWISTDPSSSKPLPEPSISTRATVTASRPNPSLGAVHDGYWPKSSADRGCAFYSLWPESGTEQWIEYRFEKTETVSSSTVYWFDDGPWGGCRIPAGWSIEYLIPENQWQQVTSIGEYPVQKDTVNAITFDPVPTAAIRLKIRLPENFSSGIYEWSVQ